MLKRSERYFKVFAPAGDGDGGELLGHYPASVSYRTSEEVESGDVQYANLRFSVYADKRRSPSGGYRRGMTLESEDGREKYHILVPVLVGRLWIMKSLRTLTDGEGDTYDH